MSNTLTGKEMMVQAAIANKALAEQIAMLQAQMQSNTIEAAMKLNEEKKARGERVYKFSAQQLEGIAITQAYNAGDASQYAFGTKNKRDKVGETTLSLYANTKGLDSGWIQYASKAKHRTDELQELVNGSLLTHSDQIVSEYYNSIPLANRQIKGLSMNQALNQLGNGHNLINVVSTLQDEVAAMRLEMAEMKAKVRNHDLAIAKVEAGQQELNAKVSALDLAQDVPWKDKAIILKNQYPKMKQVELAEACKVSLASIKKYMSSPEAKALLVK